MSTAQAAAADVNDGAAAAASGPFAHLPEELNRTRRVEVVSGHCLFPALTYEVLRVHEQFGTDFLVKLFDRDDGVPEYQEHRSLTQNHKEMLQLDLTQNHQELRAKVARFVSDHLPAEVFANCFAPSLPDLIAAGFVGESTAGCLRAVGGLPAALTKEQYSLLLSENPLRRGDDQGDVFELLLFVATLSKAAHVTAAAPVIPRVFLYDEWTKLFIQIVPPGSQAVNQPPTLNRGTHWSTIGECDIVIGCQHNVDEPLRFYAMPPRQGRRRSFPYQLIFLLVYQRACVPMHARRIFLPGLARVPFQLNCCLFPETSPENIQR